jgi:hypothetical protein
LLFQRFQKVRRRGGEHEVFQLHLLLLASCCRKIEISGKH